MHCFGRGYVTLGGGGEIIDLQYGFISGLLFEPNELDFRNALQESLSIFQSREVYEKIQANGMKRDFSWTNAAKEYEALYSESI